MAFINPDDVVKNLGLEPGMVVADFGCGSGHYTTAAAKIVGRPGAVYAIDVQKDLLASVKSRAEINNLQNIEIVWADLEKPEGSHLAGGSVDMVIISNILFQVEDRSVLIKEAFRILKNRGRTTAIEWEPVPAEGRVSKIGPQPEKRLSKEEVRDIFIKEGFKIEREFQPGESHYGIIFIKP